MIDLEAMDAAVQARLVLMVPAIVDIDTSDAIDDDLLSRRARPPAVFTCLLRRSARRKVPGLRTQLQLLELRLGIVTGGIPQTSGAVKGATGSYAIKAQTMKALHHWPLPGILGVLEFVEEDRIGSAGGRSLWEQVFVGMLQETYN